MASGRVREVKALLDRLAEHAGFNGGPTAEDQALREEVIRDFIAGGVELLDEATPFLRAYFESTVGEFSAEQRVDYGMPEIPGSADIWEHVQFDHPPQWQLGGGPLAPGRSYLSFEGEVPWEPEHGLQLVLEEGRHVCKVSPYDGHVTIAHAYGDSSLLGIVVS